MMSASMRNYGLAALALVATMVNTRAQVKTPIVLAEGPREIVVYPTDLSGNRQTPFKANLFRLTTDNLTYIRYTENGVYTDSVKSSVGRIEAVELVEPKKRWNWNLKTREFDNEPLEKPLPELVLTPWPYDAAQESRYLHLRLTALREGLERELDNESGATRERLFELAKNYGARAEEIRNPAGARLFNDLKRDFTELRDLKLRLKAIEESYRKELEQLNADKVLEIQKNNIEKSRASIVFLAGVLSAANDYDYYRKVSKGDIRLTLAGADMFVDALEREIQANEFFNTASKTLKTKQESDYLKARTEYETEWKRQRDLIAKFASERFRMNDDKRMFDVRQLVKDMSAKSDYPFLVTSLEKWCDFERGDSGRDNPFRMANLIDYRCQLYVQGHAAKSTQRYSLIADSIANTRLVPANPVYDLDRLSLYLHATSFANAVALLDSKVDSRLDRPHRISLRDTYHPASLLALRMIERIKAMGFEDTNRLVSEQEVYALAQSGRLLEATKLIRELGNQLQDNPHFQLFAARVIATNIENRKPKDVVEELTGFLRNVVQTKKSLINTTVMKSDPDLKAYAVVRSVAQLVK